MNENFGTQICVNNRQINVPFVTSLALRSASPYGDAKVNSYDR
ncbi:hypothetical protein HMPREF1621_04848 [Escherichia coli A25922R]|uniref:Uncharacterized protein n=2 Tax=Escherichia coli TaxID=562 RepID=A0A0H2VDY5_ECOL6|nr:Hypothetical protein c4025 [Escherichia coli CFT073]AER86241.1 hypothetical protein i02_3707 [Escherichia coli str. 'clone D i2']AER91160.1 hypothetical protein i14_3707 [Escherichia coli str. 'clone D i14']ANK03737.1 hypothetical protein WLH_02476 [Escherichia coli O25b:H4]EFJ56613.1 hypothetical protein HMPREF9549_01927 [Escherichia coli MS 185-1]EFJ62453.1 hypothetical protein HMPREF9553_01423 [Escherichia coli MS 200-1]EFJ90516.1 hypothetical protein HMPREF9531_04459 [Escherichia coli 